MESRLDLVLVSTNLADFLEDHTVQLPEISKKKNSLKPEQTLLN